MSNNFIIKSYFILIIVTSFDILFEENFPMPGFYSIIKMFDEVYIALLFVYTLGRKNLRNTIILKLLVIIAVVGFVGNYKSDSSLWVSVLGFYSTMKPVILFWSFSQYNFEWSDLHKLLNWFLKLFPIVFVSYLFDLFIPSFRTDIGIGAQAVDIRMGMRSLGGLFNRFTVATMFAIIFYLACHYEKPKGSKFKILFTHFMILAAFKVKDILGFATARAFGFFKEIKVQYYVILGIAVYGLFFIYITLMPEHYNLYFNSGDTGNVARVVLTTTSFVIAKDHFPFGVGWGMYASPTTMQIESHVYSDYQIDDVYGLSYIHDGGLFMSDVFWPMIIGEIGFLGLSLYVIIMFYAFYPFLKGFFVDTKDLRFLFPVFVLICYIGCSLGKPVFSGPPHSLVLWGFSGIFFSLRYLDYESA